MEEYLKRHEERKRRALDAEKKRVERRRAERRPYLDKIRGGLVGGAIGDALGYGCVMYEGEDYVDEDWVRKYCEGHAK